MDRTGMFCHQVDALRVQLDAEHRSFDISQRMQSIISMELPATQQEPSAAPILKYLGLPLDYKPSPTEAPVEFLSQHIRYLPPHVLKLFSSTTTPKQRTVVSVIRNRRLRYTESSPSELSFQAARTTWSALWEWQEIQSQAQAEGKEEQEWANKEFLGGVEKQVGKLGALLRDYQEEREAERVRGVRRQQRAYEEALPEEDEDTDEEEAAKAVAAEEVSPEDAQGLFMRRIREKFIYGQLDVSSFASWRLFRK